MIKLIGTDLMVVMCFQKSVSIFFIVGNPKCSANLSPGAFCVRGSFFNLFSIDYKFFNSFSNLLCRYLL